MAIIENKNGTYTIDYRDSNGKRRRKVVEGSKTYAKELENKIKMQKTNAKYFPERVILETTFKEASDKYWTLHCSTTKGAAKAKYILDVLNKRFGSKHLYKITAADIQTYYNEKVLNSSSSTANRHFAVIRAIFNRAIALDIFNGQNPCSRVARKKENPARTNFLDKEQIHNLLEKAPSNIKPILQCALMTGMRRGEILNLTWNDIDLKNGIIHIRDSKSGKSREIIMIPALVEVFQNLPKTQGKIFNIKTECLRKRYNKLLKELEIKDFCFHSLRHTFASQFMMNGGDLAILKNILGHSTMDLTLRYSHFAPDHIKKTLNVINNIF
ncbi:MAG: tyrosine-type recombinase/integrase [Elusimicrobiaceae bacterium]|nr:tyrosine-type recombinase/integrase [Elusimicrobiaceae bacterium]